MLQTGRAFAAVTARGILLASEDQRHLELVPGSLSEALSTTGDAQPADSAAMLDEANRMRAEIGLPALIGMPRSPRPRTATRPTGPRTIPRTRGWTFTTKHAENRGSQDTPPRTVAHPWVLTAVPKSLTRGRRGLKQSRGGSPQPHLQKISNDISALGQAQQGTWGCPYKEAPAATLACRPQTLLLDSIRTGTHMPGTPQPR